MTELDTHIATDRELLPRTPSGPDSDLLEGLRISFLRLEHPGPGPNPGRQFG